MSSRLFSSKRSLIVVSAILALLLVFPSLAFAASPHFVNASAAVNNAGNLVATFKEAGLGNDVTVHIHLDADGSAEYACINGGGNHPKATNKETVNGPVFAEGTFTSGKNGTINGSLTATPPGAGAFSCPSGQKLVLASVSYTNVVLTDVTYGDTAPIPGTFSKVFFTF